MEAGFPSLRILGALPCLSSLFLRLTIQGRGGAEQPLAGMVCLVRLQKGHTPFGKAGSKDISPVFYPCSCSTISSCLHPYLRAEPEEPIHQHC